MRPSKGFTLVELIVVLVLVGIVGVVVIPRFLAPNAFNEAAAQDGLIATIRAAQQAAIGRTDVSFEIASGGGDWMFTAKSSTTTLRTFEVPVSDVVLETGSAAASMDSCATAFDTAVAGDFSLAFKGDGYLESFTNDGTTEMVDAAFNGVRICLNDSVAASVCVSPAGYAYAGDCDD